MTDKPTKPRRYEIRTARDADIEGIIALCCEVYPESPPWGRPQLESHQRVFADGQWIVSDLQSQGKIVGYAASLIVNWDDYDLMGSWKDFTDYGMFTNHDPENGRTLYGAEIMIHPKCQGAGLGKRLYATREKFVKSRSLLRIRAGARLRGFHKYAKHLTAQEYTLEVARGHISDPTLTFQLKRGFHILEVVPGYLLKDPESQGYAAVIEWINTEVAKPKDFEAFQKSRFSFST